MSAQERFPVLCTRPFSANVLRILLDGPFTHPNLQLEQLTKDALRPPKSVVCCHLLDQGDRLGRKPRLSHMDL
jgi:hypothetical protein